MKARIASAGSAPPSRLRRISSGTCISASRGHGGVEEALAARPGAERERLAERLRHVEEAGARAEVAAAFSVAGGAAEGEQRHVLARVIGALPGRVVAVVGGDDREVAR